METDITFGRWVKRRRQALGLTQDGLGLRAGYSGETIRKVEADDRRPSREMAERLAEALEVPKNNRVAFIRFARNEGDEELAFPLSSRCRCRMSGSRTARRVSRYHRRLSSAAPPRSALSSASCATTPSAW